MPAPQARDAVQAWTEASVRSEVLSELRSILRCLFACLVVATISYAYSTLKHVKVCTVDGSACRPFEGYLPFTTFTRWCWLLEGVYFIVANLASETHTLKKDRREGGALVRALSRASQALVGVCMASALLVTVVVYAFLVPSALLLPQPAHRQGAIEILFSGPSHVMHSCNLLFMLIDLRLSPRAVIMRGDDLKLGLAWCTLYFAFAIGLYEGTGFLHYPFLDYKGGKGLHAFAACVVVVGVYVGFWRLGTRLCAWLGPKERTL